MWEEKGNNKTGRGRRWENGRVKREGKGREILCKFATPGKISSLQPVPKNPCFYTQKASVSGGLPSPDSLTSRPL